MSLFFKLAILSFQDSHGRVTCIGEQAELRRCLDSPECPPHREECEDCEWSAWQNWSECECNIGLKKRKRLIEKNGCGKACNGALSETKSCIDECTANKPVDCQLGEWSPWTSCPDAECQDVGTKLPQRFRDRSVVKTSRNGGTEFARATNQVT